MAVIGSGESRAEPVPAQAAPASTSTRSAKVWAVLGVAALVTVGVVLILTAGGERSHDPQTDPTATPSTPLDVVPVAPPVAPEIAGRRSGAEVAFRWRTGTPVLGGDTWEWKRTDTGAGQRTGETAVTVRASARVCLQVRMIRGTDASAWTEKCVD